MFVANFPEAVRDFLLWLGSHPAYVTTLHAREWEKGMRQFWKNQRLLTPRPGKRRFLWKSDTALMNVFCPCCALCWQITVQCAIQIVCLLRNRRQLRDAVEQNLLCHGVSGHVVHEPQPSACGCGMHFAFLSLCFPLASAPYTHTHTWTHTLTPEQLDCFLSAVGAAFGILYNGIYSRRWPQYDIISLWGEPCVYLRQLYGLLR